MGLTIFSAGRGAERFRRAAEIAALAEATGFDAVWTGELYNRSATVPMAMPAAGTSRVRIGCNIAYGAGRSPLIWAAGARDLDELSEGRIVLAWATAPAGCWRTGCRSAASPRPRAWRSSSRSCGSCGGCTRAPSTTTAGSTACTSRPPPRRRHRSRSGCRSGRPGSTPGMVRVAGKVADGLIAHPMTTRAYLGEVIAPELARGAREAGRDLDGFVVKGIRMCSVDVDEDAARRRLAFAIAQYVPARTYDRLMALHRWGAVQEADPGGREGTRRRHDGRGGARTT